MREEGRTERRPYAKYVRVIAKYRESWLRGNVAVVNIFSSLALIALGNDSSGRYRISAYDICVLW